jgi:single-strand DNA-binding protein
MSFNKIVVLGNLTGNPELNYTSQGTPVCTLKVASNDRERDPKTKEYVERTTFFRATAWGPKAEVIAKHFARGSEIYLEGRLRPEEWTDREGRPRVTFGIQVANFNFTGGSNRNNQRVDLPLPPAHESSPVEGKDLGLEDDDQIPF